MFGAIGHGNEPAASIIVCCSGVVVTAEGISTSTGRVVTAAYPAPVFRLYTLTAAVVLRLWIPAPTPSHAIREVLVTLFVHASGLDNAEF